ncbi:MAG: hypothetical protein ACRC2J_19805, partial [Microcoleaceae cyanobacterium]
MISIGEMQPEPENSMGEDMENQPINNTPLSDEQKDLTEEPFYIPETADMVEEWKKEPEILEPSLTNQIPDIDSVIAENIDDIQDNASIPETDNNIKTSTFNIPNPWDDDVDESLYQPSHQEYYDYSDNPVVAELADQVQALEKTKQ